MAVSESETRTRKSPDERYELVVLLGRGAMGEVWKAHHVLMKRDVAIKFLTPEVASRKDIAARFLREAQAVSQLDHPNICRALDFGEDVDGGLYLVMEYVQGETLGELLSRESPLPAQRAFAILRQIVTGIAVAHEGGIVHRDLKPDNVMMTADARGGELIKLLDFGIAKVNPPDDVPEADRAKLTQAGTIFGTPAYMAPEQAVGGAVDAAADVYAVGSILYEMLAGRPAFEGDNIWDLLRAKLERDPDPLPGPWPARLRQLVERMMSRVPEERPSIPELEAELKSYQGAPFDAELAQAVKGRSTVRRPVWPLVAGALVLVGLVAGFFYNSGGPDLGTDAKGLQVLATTIAPKVEKKEPSGVADTLTLPMPLKRVYCHVAVKTNHTRTLTLVFYRNDEESNRYRVKVRSSPRYRSWAKFGVKEPGTYRCDALNEDGVVLGSHSVEVVNP